MRALLFRILAAGLAVPVAIAMLGVSPCTAQMSPGVQRTLTGAAQNAQKPQVAPPPVLPGTKASPEAAAPSASAANMTPTDALFDAINRGDLAAAREAVNRGAELQAQNILGLRPLELSVDLGRNDISFMLLSMRDGDAASRATARQGGNPAGADQRDAVLRASASARTFSRSRIAAEAADEPVVAPRLYSGNGGAPIPAAGFLGFDGGRTVR